MSRKSIFRLKKTKTSSTHIAYSDRLNSFAFKPVILNIFVQNQMHIISSAFGLRPFLHHKIPLHKIRRAIITILKYKFLIKPPPIQHSNFFISLFFFSSFFSIPWNIQPHQHHSYSLLRSNIGTSS